MSSRLPVVWSLAVSAFAVVVPGPCAVGLSAALADTPGLAGAAAKPYTVTVAKVEAKKGQPATATVVITPGAGYHVNKEFPISLKLRPPAGVTAQKNELDQKDAKVSEQEGSFQVVLTSNEAGKKTVPGNLRFAVCTDSTCDPQKSAVAIEMDVQ